MFEGLVRFVRKLRAPGTVSGVLDEAEAGRRHVVLPPLLLALGEFHARQTLEVRPAVRALLLHLDDVAGGTPTRRWTTQLDEHLAQAGRAAVMDELPRWLELIDVEACRFSPALPKGLVWASRTLDGEVVARLLGALAERADRKVPGRGPMSRGVVNACLKVLGELDSDAGVAQLTRLKGVVEYREAHQQLDRAFAGAASKRELSVDELEDQVVPDVAGLTAPIGVWTPSITFDDGAPVLGWVRDDGRRTRRVPAELQRDHADAVNERKARFSEFEEVLEAQAHRLERLFWTQRAMPLAAFRQHTLSHPVVSLLARALVWTVGDRPALWFDDAFVDAPGQVFDADPGAAVRLWHPALADDEAVATWRARLAALELTQPFLQVERPVFSLTESERAGGVTRRWEGRRLRQQRLHVMCRRRQWQATRLEPRQADAVVRVVEPWAMQVLLEVLADGDETTASQAATWLRTGALRLSREAGLEALSPVVASEVLYEVDAIVRGSEAG
ncbi:MAG: DUF4132 domain-containing protein [Myxococcaceae bacterium]|jgi:hypothetical protein|nr:DUF4132 domain-containing protein [Myxococcaceae bacterium]